MSAAPYELLISENRATNEHLAAFRPLSTSPALTKPAIDAPPNSKFNTIAKAIGI
jgi:hypothetical protein